MKFTMNFLVLIPGLLLAITANVAHGETATPPTQPGVVLKAPATAEKIAALPACRGKPNEMPDRPVVL